MTDKVVAPTPEQLERVEDFIREPVLLNGDDPKIALAAGTIRRRAFDDALAEIESGAEEVSRDWARKYALALGLEREISVPEPKLVDGTVLNAHQVDVLSGTLAALMSDDETLDGGPYADGGEFDEEDFEDEVEESAQDESEDIDADIDWDVFEDEEEEEKEDTAEYVLTGEHKVGNHVSADAALYDSEEQLPEQPEDPYASRRFWFEHATGAGKSVAALGFVEACRTGGVLILTHRRNLVDQFIGELVDRGYKDRLSPPMLGSDGHMNGPVTVETYQWYVR
ncbi:MAG: hypothetical protein JHC95_17855, partial [Solirubrobacteraceae bacterium]|nr:hypothetical protein [Solirubrobacteraceae bacterium]